MAIRYAPEYPFQQTGPPQYAFGGFSFDTMTVPFRGERPLLDAFLASPLIAPWVVSPLDIGMYLDSYHVGQDRVAPEVILHYTGKRKGILTAGKHESDDVVASASRSFPDPLNATLVVQYYGPSNSLSWISRGQHVLGPSGDVLAPNDPIRIITVDWSQTIAGFNQNVNLAGDGTISNILVELYFSEILVKTRRSEEVAAGQFWQNTNRITKQLVQKVEGTVDGSLYATFGISIDATEVNAGGRGADFIQLTSSGNIVLGLYLHDGNWNLYTTIGGTQTVTLPASLPLENQFHNFAFKLTPNGDGTWTAIATIDGVNTFPITSSTVVVNNIKAGAPGAAGTIDHRVISALLVGKALGYGDIFLGGATATLTGLVFVPPWDQVIGNECTPQGGNAIQAIGSPHRNSFVTKNFTGFHLT